MGDVPRISRRTMLRGSATLAAGAVLARPVSARASARPLRAPGSLPNPHLPAGTPDESLPFDHIVVVMMENHSFDNYFGMLPVRGQPKADGFRFDAHGRPTNANPVKGGKQVAFHMETPCQPGGVTQAWTATHEQIDHGRMDGFAKTCPTAMGYWDEEDLPFYYSLANTFTLANRWFSSAPCQTYPNRRFLYAGTASGDIATTGSSIGLPPPPAGTIMDLCARFGLSCRNYFTDLPATAIIYTDPLRHPTDYVPITQFFVDCALGTLPAVSFVDPEFGLIDDVGGSLASGLQGVAGMPQVIVDSVNRVNTLGGSEENPSDIRLGEAFVSQVVRAVMRGPAWKRTLLVWTYDEHGGYYDHVPPPAARKPDNVLPMLQRGDAPGGYNLYGIRVPTVVVSPYSRPHAVTNVVHDHTSVLATIEKRWNLPALTYRDANATTMEDFLDLSRPPAFLTPPTLAAPTTPTLGLKGCDVDVPPVVVTPSTTGQRTTAAHRG